MNQARGAVDHAETNPAEMNLLALLRQTPYASDTATVFVSGERKCRE